MQRNTFNYRTGSSSSRLNRIDDVGQERYHDLLREAEQYRLEQRALRAHHSTNHQASRQIAKSPITRLLVWAGILSVKPLSAG